MQKIWTSPQTARFTSTPMVKYLQVLEANLRKGKSRNFAASTES